MDYRLTTAADADVDEIWLYIARDSVDAAENFTNKMFNCFASLGRTKLKAQLRDELDAGLRSFPFGNYIIFFYVTPELVTISRVIHGARDLKEIFEQTEG